MKLSDPSLKAIIRIAKENDGAEIANVHLNSWQESYQGLMPVDFLSRMPLTFKARMNYWNKVIAEKSPECQILVAESSKHGIVGFAIVGKARDEKFSDGAELGAIYLLKHYQNSGNGFALLKEAFSFLKKSGYQRAYCWVLKNNPTIAFYEKTGAVLSGDEKVESNGAVELAEVACVWNDLSLF
jgi:GNAT superfamily N-acetyltransferase